MDLSYTQEEEAFRDEVREFLATELPSRMSEKIKLGRRLTKDDMIQWHEF